MKPWRFVLRMAGFRIWLFIGSGVFASLLFYAIPLLPGLIVREIFQRLEPDSGHRGMHWPLLALLVGIGAGRMAGLMAGAWTESSVHLYVGALLRRNMLVHVLRRPGARAIPFSSGEAISRFRDDTDVACSFLTWTLDPLGQITVIVLAIVLLAAVDPILTLGVFLPLVAVIVIARIAGTRVAAISKANQEAIGSVTGMIGEMFGAVTAIKTLGAEERVADHFAKVNEIRRHAHLKDVLVNQVLQSLSTNMANIGTGIILLLSAQAIRSGDVSVGDLALFVSYLSWLSVVVGMFGFYLNQYRQFGVSQERMAALMDASSPAHLVEHAPVYLRGPLPPPVSPPPPVAEPLRRLEVQGLTARYPDTGRGIEDVSLTLRRGTMTVVVGEVGAGKTTLLRAILGLIPHEAGSILWNQRPIADPAAWFVPPHASYTPQTPRLFGESLRDNILLGLPQASVDLPAALHAAVLDRDVARLGEGLDTMLGTRGVRLSGGQLQRSAAARMFVRPAELYVFDDLSSALDVETERELWSRLFQRPPATMLVVSHRHSALRRADQVIVLERDRVIASGSLDEVMATSETMRHLWHGGEHPAPEPAS